MFTHFPIHETEIEIGRIHMRKEEKQLYTKEYEIEYNKKQYQLKREELVLTKGKFMS